MKILAFDLGLGTTGICLPDGTTQAMRWPHKGHVRLCFAFGAITSLCSAHTPDVIAIEGYAMGARGKTFQIGELGGVARLAVALHDITQLEVAPTSIKKYATGKGNANKAELVSAAVQRSGRTFATEDEADAWWLWALVNDLYGQPVVTMPATNRTALDKYILTHDL